MHSREDQQHGGDDDLSWNGLNLGEEESGKKPQKRKLRVDTTGTYLAPGLHNDDPDDGSRSLSRPRTPSAVSITLRDPYGETTALFRDKSSAASEEDLGGKHIFYSQGNSGSEHSFASIKTINDLGFERQALARPTADQGSVYSDSAETQGPNAQDQLAKRLRAAYFKSAASDEDGKFIPISNLETIITRETIQDVLKQQFPELQTAECEAELDKLTHDICPARQRLFALLVLNQSAKCIRCFVKCGVTDMDFPFAQAPDASESAAVHPRGDVGFQRPLHCFREWKLSEVEWFLRWQHVVASPFFDLAPGSLYLYILPKDSVLPFLESERAGEGGHANVWKVLIHPAHHNFPTQPGTEKQYFAVKTLHTRQRGEYEREVKVLERFSGRHKGHPHLIRLLLTYQHKDSYHLVFPWANGNLRDFWESVRSPQRTQETARWMLAQCFGIADGLQQLHGNGDVARLSPGDKNTGRHGDIKPENILWLKDHNDSVNHLLISDFGLSRFHSYQSQSVDKLPGCSPSYRPPECDLYRMKISVKYDIWTLGCLLLDCLTWYLRGWNAVDTEFIDARLGDEGWTPFDPLNPNSISTADDRCFYEDKFYKQSNDGTVVSAQLKPSVIKWMEELHNLDYCPEFAHDLLRVIHQGLLHPNKRSRWDCARVVTELGKICNKCDSSTAYCTAPYKWEGGPLEIFTVSYHLKQVETLNSVMAIAQQQEQTGGHSPRSLSPVSRASGTHTPPPEEEEESQDAEFSAAAAAPLDKTSASARTPEPATTSPAEPEPAADRAPDLTQVPDPLPGSTTRSQTGLSRYFLTPGTTMNTQGTTTTTDTSRPLITRPPHGGDGGGDGELEPQTVRTWKGSVNRAWSRCKKGVRRLGCCLTSSSFGSG